LTLNFDLDLDLSEVNSEIKFGADMLHIYSVSQKNPPDEIF